MANGVYEKLQRCTDAVREKISFQPEVALILGSGLGDYADEMKIVERIGIFGNRGVSRIYGCGA